LLQTQHAACLPPLKASVKPARLELLHGTRNTQHAPASA
jgi:hypothetical protein